MSHEQLKDYQNNKDITNKSFGIQLSLIFFIIFLIRFYFSYFAFFEFTLIFLSVFFAILSFFKPSFLTFFKKLFLELGMLLARIINPIVMLVFYIFIFIPFGVVLKFFNYNPLNEKIDKDLNSYWSNLQNKNKKYFKKQF